MSRLPLLAILVPALAGGCRNDDRVLVPNRVLDRPLDLALACVRVNADGTDVEVLSLNTCNSAGAGSCTDVSPQLIGFVANSERNEVGVFRRCDRNALVDLDIDAPGYQLVPVGRLPSRLVRTGDNCKTVTSNVGSCDLSILDVTGLGALALEVPLDGAPSGLVSRLQPRRADGELLAASPGDIIPVPSDLSLAAGAPDEDPFGEDDPFGDDDDDDDDEGGTGGVQGGGEPGLPGTGGDDDDDEGSGGVDPDEEIGATCREGATGSVYVTFPSCQLVAELDLATGRILQSRRFVVTPEGDVEVEDTGTNPDCPLDCPGQLDGDPPDDRPSVQPDGMFPGTLALVEVPVEDPEDPLDDAEQQVVYHALYVGGAGSDRVVEIEVEPQTGFVAPELTSQLELEDSQGVQAIRPTPAATVLGDPHQFLYVIAGDGSTRVVDRDFVPGRVGIECDTQVDPTQVANSACHPIDPGQIGNAPDRRAFAAGPGIRAEGGATINDWTFYKVERTLDEIDPTDSATSPFSVDGMVGVGVTSFGFVTFVNFGQLSGGGATVPGVDPVGLMDTEVRPHALWPRVVPATELADALPLVADEEPGRSLGGDDADAFALAPTLRRIDRAYSIPTAEEGAVSAEQVAIAESLFTPGPGVAPENTAVSNVDQLGGFEENTRLYDNAVARVTVRDYVQWSPQAWALEWEGAIPGTGSGTGLVECDNHGGVDGNGNQFAGGTCRSSMPGDIRLVDESADLCDRGVLPGDKLLLPGCNDDGQCGLGQVCLRSPTAPSSATGICISEQEASQNLEELRAACGSFITDPCGVPIREYRITRAFQNELWLQAMDVPSRSIVREVEMGESTTLAEWEAPLSCAAPVPHRDYVQCRSDDECRADPYDPDGEALTSYFCDIDEDAAADDPDLTGLCASFDQGQDCTADIDCASLGLAYVCADAVCRAPCNLCAPDGPQPEDACLTDDDCVTALGDGHTCFAGTCHVPCEDDNPGCIQSPLPGPRCFPEFVRYSVRAKDSFTVEGSGSPFFSDAVSADPATGECIEDPTVSNLLTSRLRLGADEADTFGHPVWGIPDCPNAQQAQPSDPNPCRITASRGLSPDSLFHYFEYEGSAVEAIRFSNPQMSMVMDLTSLRDLALPDPVTGRSWPADFSRYSRARIPRGYRQEFAARDGYDPFNEIVVVGTTPVVYPVRILPAPEPGVAYIVDAGGRGGVAGVRGQVVRVTLGDQVLADENFRVQ